MKFYTDVQRFGNQIFHTYYENGKRFYKKEKFKPYLFVEGDGDFTSLMDNKPLEKKRFDNITSMRDWIEEYKDVTGFKYYGLEDVIGQFIAENYPGEIQFDPDIINMVSFDIEVDTEEGFSSPKDADQPITCLTTKSSKNNKYWLFYYEEDFVNDEEKTGIPDNQVFPVKCKDEKDMLKKFVMWWKNDYPDVVSGWNCEGFDIPYIVNRIAKILGEEWVDKLSPWGYVKERNFEMFGNEQQTYEISGMTVLDYMDVFKKFGVLTYGTPASFKLDHIAHVILGDRKISYGEYGDLNGLWKKNKNLYYQYNVKDTILIQRFEDETSLIGLVYSIAYSAGVNFAGALGTVLLWDNILNRFCLDNKKVIPCSPKREKGGTIPGGYVKDPIVGLHKNVVSFDLASLYPHLMMQYNISPETYIKQVPDISPEYYLNGNENPNPKYSMCANGALFTNEFRGMIPTIIDEKYSQRSVAKKEMLETEKEIEKLENLLKNM